MVIGAERVCWSASVLAIAVGLTFAGSSLSASRSHDRNWAAKFGAQEQAGGQSKSDDQSKKEQKDKKDEKARQERKAEKADKLPAVLWRDPGDIASLDLVNGAGEAAHAPDPKSDYAFVKEDTNGTSPKFYARDANGVEWLVKIGVEAKPETAATRFVWAMGYFTDEDYFLPQIHVTGLEKLHRKMIGASLKTGIVLNVRLKRQGPDLKKVENWKWLDNPFEDTREFRGLLVLMALINNWDLKEANNKVYVGDNERHFVVSDLGAAFGRTGWPIVPPPVFPLPHATKGVLKDYKHSKFIVSVQGDTVKFEMNIATPFFIEDTRHALFSEYARNAKLENAIPIEDARWVGRQMARLTPQQIRGAFRTAGYPPEEVEGFAKVVEQRIAELIQLGN
jgi:hypothetical protein